MLKRPQHVYHYIRVLAGILEILVTRAVIYLHHLQFSMLCFLFTVRLKFTIIYMIFFCKLQSQLSVAFLPEYDLIIHVLSK